NRVEGEWLMAARWPLERNTDDADATADFGMLQAAITAIRLRRATDKVSPAETRPAVAQAAPEAVRRLLESNASMIERLARIDSLEFVDDSTAVVGETVLLGGRPVTFALRRTDTDRAAEQERIRREMQRLGELAAAQEGKLANEAFTSRAPAAVVEREREKLAALLTERDALQRQLGN
ncbi:MAG TPA: hypothetical protein PLL69_08810, partial [Gemmatimonadales bacterium]|nr:hypothetical protein [Gemmatimonadales bacterium]